jgi:cytoskeleton protein RodZ
LVNSTAAAPAPNPNAAVRVQVVAAEPVWVLARADGKYLFSGTLGANESRTVEANGAVLLRLGNAGGVTVLLNGKPLPALGPKGQVRDVQLTPGGFQIVAAPKPSVEPLL